MYYFIVFVGQGSGLSLTGSSVGSHKPAIKVLGRVCSLVEPRIPFQASVVIGGTLRGTGLRATIFLLSDRDKFPKSPFLEALVAPCHGPSPQAHQNMEAFFLRASRRLLHPSRLRSVIQWNCLYGSDTHHLCHILMGRRKSQVLPTGKGRRLHKSVTHWEVVVVECPRKVCLPQKFRKKR